MVYTTRAVEQATIKIIADPVLEFLNKTNPDKIYKARGKDLGENIRIFEYDSSSLWSRIFPKEIAQILSDCSGYFKPSIKSFDESILPQQKLEELLQGVDLKGITMNAVFARIGAVDYS